MEESDRDDLLRNTPEKYLAEGYLDEQGMLRPELRGEYATAAATQLLAADVSPQELSLLVAGVHEVLPLHTETDAQERVYATIVESTELIVRTLQQPLNETLRQWLYAVGNAVFEDAEIPGFLEHLDVVNRQYGIMAAMLSAPGQGEDADGRSP